MKVLYKISLTVFLLSVFLLVTGSPLLMYPILKTPEIPLGNLTTSLGMIAFPTMLLTKLNINISTKKKTKRFLLIGTRMALALAALWWPLGRYLSGNWRNSFQDIPIKSSFFWTLTYCLIVYIILLWILYFLTLSFSRKKSN